MATHMPHEVDQDIDSVGPYQIGQCIIGEACRTVPCCCMRAKTRSDIILLQRIRIAHHFERFRIVGKKHAAETIGRGMVAEMAAHVPDPETAVRDRVVRMGTNARRKRSCVQLVPSSALGLLLGGCRFQVEIAHKDQVAVKLGLAGSDALIADDGLVDFALVQQGIATANPRVGVAGLERECLV